jgi:hypothetical protein
VYQKLYEIKPEPKKEKPNQKEQPKQKEQLKEQNDTFFKQEIAEGIYEIKEPYNPEQEKNNSKVEESEKNKKIEVMGFDDFLKETSKPQKKEFNAKQEVNKILGLNKPKPKPKSPPKEIKQEPAPKKTSLFKQRMLARRQGK